MSGIETVPAPSILVRDARPEDMPVLQAIYAHHVLHSVATFEEVPPDLAEMHRRREEILARGFPYVVAEHDGVVEGYAYCNSFRTRSAYRYTVEDSVYVAPDAVGKGFGRAAMREVIGRATALGLRQMVAVTGDSPNSASIRMHERLGFHREAVLHAVGFKFGRWVDGVIMQLALGEGDGTPPAR
jgi:phosphinothricin acetyltransferase